MEYWNISPTGTETACNNYCNVTAKNNFFLPLPFGGQETGLRPEIKKKYHFYKVVSRQYIVASQWQATATSSGMCPYNISLN